MRPMISHGLWRAAESGHALDGSAPRLGSVEAVRARCAMAC